MGSTGKMDLITTENQYTNQKDKLVAISRNIIINRACKNLLDRGSERLT